MDLLVPSTFGADERDTKQRIVKYGMLARAASVFGAERIIIYDDPDDRIDTRRSAAVLEKHLVYAECPPYLKRELIPYDEDLENANILPPLQIESHGYNDTFREAVVLEADEGELTLEAGLENDLTAYGDREEGERLTVKVIEGDRAQIIDSDSLDRYWGFAVENRDQTLGDVLDTLEKPVIATSRHGDGLHNRADEVRDLATPAVVFGSAWRGIPDMVDRGDLTEDQYDLLVNCVPGQHTKTVRTEEALFSCLSLFNYIRTGDI
jgi:predicted SPOUT superfamily RNA methylase MTH1